MQPLEETRIPTILPVLKNFAPGKGIKILGTIPPGALSFIIDLHCGKDFAHQGDIALHMVFDFIKSNASINSQRKNAWDEEHSIPGFPFNRGERVEIVVACDCFNYKIFINGQHYSDFIQNISYEDVTYLALNGDIIIEQLSCEVEVLTYTSFGFKECDIPLQQHQRLLQSADVTLGPDIADTPQESRPKWKIYATYGAIAVTILVVTLCAVFISTKKKNEYDFD